MKRLTEIIASYLSFGRKYYELEVKPNDDILRICYTDVLELRTDTLRLQLSYDQYTVYTIHPIPILGKLRIRTSRF